MTELTAGGADPSISPEEQQTVEMVTGLFAKYKKARECYDKNWMHYYRMFRGDQWDGVKMPRHRQREVVNMIWAAIQNSQSQQLDVRPRISYVAQEPSDQPFAEVLNQILNADWERHNWLVPLTELVLDGYIYGTGFGEIGYDAEADYGMGTVTFYSADPFYLYPDPNACEINGKYSDGLIKAEPMDIAAVKRMYPERADLIKADIKDAVKSSKTSLNEFTFKQSNTDLDMPDLTFLRGGTDKLQEKCLVITAYLKPHDTEEIEEELESTGEGTPITRKVLRKVYPNGRTIKICSGIVLEDIPSLPFKNGLFPFVKYCNYLLPREFWGVSEVEQLESPQRVFNKLLNAALETMALMGNPAWVISTDSNVNPHSLVNKTGMIIQKEPGSEVNRIDGIQPSASAMALADRMEVWFNQVAGTHEVASGETPGSVTAASAIEALQEAARTRIKQKQRNLDATIKDWGQHYADVSLEKYIKPRVFRVTNDEQGTQFFRMSVEPIVDETGRELKKATLRPYQQDQMGNLQPTNEVKEFLIAGRFDVITNTSSSLPFAKAKQEERVLNLFDRGIVDAQEVLNTLEYPNAQAVLQRLQQKAAEEAQAAMLQGGPK